MQKQNFNITDAAARRIKHMSVQKGNPKLKFRLKVLGGGCSGFQYDLKFDDKQSDDDQIFSNQDAMVIIDNKSIKFLNGSTLDYIEDLGSAEFKIVNPNATAKCGCGNSFSVM
jgi:iron-sulfur cluster insertion protein